MQKRADSVIFADNLLIADDLKDKIKGYANKQDKRLDIEFKKWEPIIALPVKYMDFSLRLLVDISSRLAMPSVAPQYRIELKLHNLN